MSGSIALRPNPAGQLEVRDKRGMLVAVKTCTVTDEFGKPEQLTAGITRVSAPHYLTTTYPHLFGPERVTAGRRRSKRTRAVARPPASARASIELPSRDDKTWKPLVRLDTKAAPSFTAQLSERAYLSMSDQAFAHREGCETGGALFGAPASNGASSMLAKRALAPGPGTSATPSSFDLDRRHVHAEVERLRRDGSPVTWVGSWHTHPNPGADEPSDGDLAASALDCRQIRHLAGQPHHYIGLILTPRWDGDKTGRYRSWVKPTVTAWHMHPVADDQFICTKAEVVRC